MTVDGQENIEITERTEGEKHRLMRERSGFFLLCAAAVGIARPLCFCNAGGLGLNTLVFAAVWLICTVLCLKRLELWSPKKSAVYCAGILLAALSSFMTMNEFVQCVNAVGIVLLMGMLLLSSFCETGLWQFGKYFKAMFMLIFGALKCLTEPVKQLWRLCRRGREGSGKLGYVLIGLLISIPLAAVVTLLLCSADEMFGHMLDSLFYSFEMSEAAETVLKALCGFLMMFFVFYCVLSGQADRPVPSDIRPAKMREAAVAVTFMGVLALIYVVFCAIQVIYLFGGHSLPEGFTYSLYARQGFFELLFVSALNLLLVTFCTWKFGRGRALKILLMLISACTYIMLVSSAYRMVLYVQAYGLSFLRILVLWFLLLLAVILGGIAVYIRREKFNLFRFTFTVSLIMWLCFAFARADRIAAAYNAEKIGVNDEIAMAMIYDLSEDAVPVMARCRYGGMWAQEWNEHLEGVSETVKEHGVRGFNLSLWQAVRSVNFSVAG